MTVNEIKEKLDELGIEYDSNARKDDLLKLLSDHGTETEEQKSYVVVYHRWKDLEDNDRIYKKGEPFDSEGKTEERIAELSSKNNKIRKVLIKETD